MRQPAEKPGVPELAREQKVQRFCRGKSWGGRYVLEDAKSCRGALSPVPLETLLQPPPHTPRSGPWNVVLLWEGDNLPVTSPPLLPQVLKMEDFFPETYRLDIRDEREAFFHP